jgi:hypothetical protein
MASFELQACSSTPDEAMAGLAGLTARLRGAALELWRGAAKREFNIGFETAVRRHVVEHVLQPETVAAVAAVGGAIAVTLYTATPSSTTAKPQRRTTARRP